MMRFLDLDRKFVQRDTYSADELVAVEIRGTQVGWSTLLRNRLSVIVAPANFGKTEEMRQRARQLRSSGTDAVFVELRRLADRASFDKALNAEELRAYRAWQERMAAPLFLFVDSLDEAAAGRHEELDSLIATVADTVGWPNDSVSWVISTRPAVLTPTVIERLQDALSRPLQDMNFGRGGMRLEVALARAEERQDEQSSKYGSEEVKLKLFSMLELGREQGLKYLRKLHEKEDAEQVLNAAVLHGLLGFAHNPGGLDLLARMDLVEVPPQSLTDVYERVLHTLQVDGARDARIEDVGVSTPAVLGAMSQRLAAASVLCQRVNIEMLDDFSGPPADAISARLIADGSISERALKHLLGTQLFKDAGFHQVKVYPDELLPFLAAKWLAGLVESDEQAARLLSRFTWAAPTGEKGVHGIHLPLMGWLATLNRHCRSIILDVEPQALAFFGDLRNKAVHLDDAKHALREAVRRVADEGGEIGRGAYRPSAENYWQVGRPGIEPLVCELFDEYGEHPGVRYKLTEVAGNCRFAGLRAPMLAAHGGRYESLLEGGRDVYYLLGLGLEEDLTAFAEEIKRGKPVTDFLLSVLIDRLCWRYLSPRDCVAAFKAQLSRGNEGFHVAYSLSNPSLLAGLTLNELHDLARRLAVLAARCGRAALKGGAMVRDGDRYVLQAALRVTAELIRRSTARDEPQTARSCLFLQRILLLGYSRDVNAEEYLDALKQNRGVRVHLLDLMARSKADEVELVRLVHGHAFGCVFQSADFDSVPYRKLEQAKNWVAHLHLNSELLESREAGVRIARADTASSVPEATKAKLAGMLESLSDGSAVNELTSIAAWLVRRTNRSRYGEVNVSLLAEEFGAATAEAVVSGFGVIWRSQLPSFDGDVVGSIQPSTVAGLQGLYIEFGDGSLLPPLTASEVKLALHYGVFEMNGRPAWYWKVAHAYPELAQATLLKLVEGGNDGAFQRRISEALLVEFRKGPSLVVASLGSLAWQYLVRGCSTDAYVDRSLLLAAMELPVIPTRAEFERVARNKVMMAFSSSANDIELSNKEVAWARSEAIKWAVQWLQSYPKRFVDAVSAWGPKAPSTVKLFLFRLAAHLGRERGGELLGRIKRSDEMVEALESVYRWTQWAVSPADDNIHAEGVSYTPNERDHAEQFRSSISRLISLGDSESAYKTLERLKTGEFSASNDEACLRQVQLRERQALRPPLAQSDFASFERNLTANITDSVSFALGVHSDLLEVKYQIERGEHSLRAFFNRIQFAKVAKKGAEGESFGLALESDFQALLASELNHAARGRYSVTLEPQTAERKRRDVQCSKGEWRASIELKMSVRWSVEDYLVALKDQLIGQYMRHNKANVGFLVIVLQKAGQIWPAPIGGKRLDFKGLIELLQARALELQKRSMYLRVIGIDATEPPNFRKLNVPKSVRTSRSRP